LADGESASIDHGVLGAVVGVRAARSVLITIAPAVVALADNLDLGDDGVDVEPVVGVVEAQLKVDLSGTVGEATTRTVQGQETVVFVPLRVEVVGARVASAHLVVEVRAVKLDGRASLERSRVVNERRGRMLIHVLDGAALAGEKAKVELGRRAVGLAEGGRERVRATRAGEVAAAHLRAASVATAAVVKTLPAVGSLRLVVEGRDNSGVRRGVVDRDNVVHDIGLTGVAAQRECAVLEVDVGHVARSFLRSVVPGVVVLIGIVVKVTAATTARVDRVVVIAGGEVLARDARRVNGGRTGGRNGAVRARVRLGSGRRRSRSSRG